MAGFSAHPFETSMCIWALVFSLLVCLIMVLMKKVLLRNNILFFFWFMVNTVFQVLEITALGREDVLPYRSLIQLVYVINTIVIMLALAAGLNRGMKNMFRFRREEWVYIGVNTAGILGVLTSVRMVVSLGTEAIGTLPMILWTLLGVVSMIGAVAADLTLLAPLHRRLRRSSPHMIYIFCVAVSLSATLFILIIGLNVAGTVYTVAMLLLLIFYLLAKMYRRSLNIPEETDEAGEQPAAAVSAAQEKPEETEEKVKIIKEIVPSSDPALLAQNPHFICNTLNTVYYQIDHNTGSAKKAVVDLSDYMQGKYNALRADHMIPFETEIKIMNRYLSLQKLRYEELLNVSTNFESTGFLLPALSIQTIIEHVLTNILQHRRDGGTLRVETSRSSECNLIRISCDDDINDAESVNHIFAAFPLLEAARKRVDAFCGGTIKAHREGTKTVFEIRIPIPEDSEPLSADAPAAPADPV